MLSQQQLVVAHDHIRNVAQEVAEETDDPEAFDYALLACDRLRLACRVSEWSREHWLSRALEASLRASALEAKWVRLTSRIETLLACHLGLSVN